MAFKIAVTGGEGLVAHYWKSLENNTGFRFDLFDANPLEDSVKRIPLGNSTEFLIHIKRLSNVYNRLILAVDEEIWNISKNTPNLPYRKFLNPLGKGILPFVDKYTLTRLLAKLNIPYPKSYLPSQIKNPLKGKWVIKKRLGRGSKGLKIEENPKLSKDTGNDFVVQEFIGGQKIHFDILCSPEEFVVIERRTLELFGAMDRSFEIRFFSKFEKELYRIVKAILKVSYSKRILVNIDTKFYKNKLFILEINPRPSVYFPYIFSSKELLSEIFKDFMKKGRIKETLKREIKRIKPYEVYAKVIFFKRFP